MKTLFFVLLPFFGFSQIVENNHSKYVAKYHYSVSDDQPFKLEGTITIDKVNRTIRVADTSGSKLYTGIRKMPNREGVQYAAIHQGEIFFLTIVEGGFGISLDYQGTDNTLYLYTTGND